MNKHLKSNRNIYIFTQAFLAILMILVLILSNQVKAQDMDTDLDGVAIEDEKFIEDDEYLTTQEVLATEVCIDEQGKCLDNKQERVVGGLPVKKECWHYEYIKKCNKIPSKNNCSEIPLDKFNLKKEKCLASTKIGDRDFCLNMSKTFSYVYDEVEIIDKSEIIMDPDNKEVVKDLLCDAFCLDGNCPEVHKGMQEANDEIASAIAQLEMLSDIKKGFVGANGLNINVFGGQVRKCHNKTSLHSNCCIDSGLFKDVGLIKCSAEQKSLATESRKGKCEYIDEYCSTKDPILKKICLIKTKSYCCYPTVLAKTIRLGARDQLGKGLGTAEDPQCGGLSLNDLERIDFSKINFDDFFNREVQPMMRVYDSQDNEKLIKRSFPIGQQSTTKSAQPSYGHDSFTDTNYDGTSYKLFEESE